MGSRVQNVVDVQTLSTLTESSCIYSVIWCPHTVSADVSTLYISCASWLFLNPGLHTAITVAKSLGRRGYSVARSTNKLGVVMLALAASLILA